jgi:hypothetical protein
MAAGSGASGQVCGLSSRCGSVVKAPSSAGTGIRVLTRQVAHPHAEKSASGWGHPCAPGMVLDMSNAYLVTEGAYPDPKGRAIDVMTAHDPGGRIASDPANASAEAWLAVELERRGLTRWPAAGGNSSWTHVEPGAAVVGTEEADAGRAGRRFRTRGDLRAHPR